MESPYSRIPAVPAAIGLASGIALQATPVAPAVLCGVGIAAVVAAVWIWRMSAFFASAPAALAIGMALAAWAPAMPEAAPLPARGAVAEAIYMSPMNGSAAAFAATTIAAEDSYLQEALRNDFRGSGLAHLLALSGFHVGVVAMIALWATAPVMLMGRARHVRWLMVLAAVWAFALLGGMRPSLMRAAIMSTMLLVARGIGRYSSSVNALAVAAIVILAVRPSALSDVGFQLSFAAVFGILVFAPALNPFPLRRGPLHAFGAVVAVPVSATLATAPIIASVFGTFPLLFLPANIIAAVLFTPFYVLALSAAVLSASGVPCGVLARCADGIYALISGVASQLNFAVGVRFGTAALTLSYVAIGAVALRLLTRRR